VIGEQDFASSNHSQLPVTAHLVDAVEATVFAIASGRYRPPRGAGLS
jgi:hypothetical protein